MALAGRRPLFHGRRGVAGAALAVLTLAGAHLGDGPVQAAEQEVVDHALFAEPHLVLGGVHVHIHQRRVHFEEQHIGRVAAVVEHVRVGLAHRVADHLVADHPAVDVEILQIRLGPGEGGQAHPAVQPQAGVLDVHGQCLIHEGTAAQPRHPGGAQGVVVPGRQLVDHFLVVAEAEAGLEFAQGDPPEHLFQVVEFGFLGAQETAPGRRIEEQVAHRHGAAARVRGGRHGRRHVAPFHGNLPALGLVAAVAGQAQPRHRTDRRQRLAPETEGADRLQVFEAADLAGGVAGQGQRQVILVDAAAVVAHPDQLGAALLHVHGDLAGAGVERVFQQLLKHRGGALHHLAGGDLVGEPGIQPMNLCHRELSLLKPGCAVRTGEWSGSGPP